jgi:hypothetical protein
VTSRSICAAVDSSGNVDLSIPRLLLGETTQGFITVKHIPSREQNEPLRLANITQLELRNIV